MADKETLTEEELVQQFQDDKVQLSDLPDELQAKILDGSWDPPQKEEVTEEVTEPEATETEETEEVTEEPKAEEDASAEDKGKRKKKSVQELRELALERANRINQLEQERQSHERKLKADPKYREEYFSKLGIEQSKPKDVWSEEHQQTVAQELAEMKERLQKYEEERKLNDLYNSLEGFATQTMGHKFEAPIREIDRATKLLAQSQGKEPTQEELVELGFAEDDVKSFNRLIMVQRFQHANGMATFEEAYKSLYGDVVKPRVEDDSEVRRERMRKALNAPKMMPSQRATQAEQGMTQEVALQWLEAHPDPRLYGDKENEMWGRVQRFLGM